MSSRFDFLGFRSRLKTKQTRPEPEQPATGAVSSSDQFDDGDPASYSFDKEKERKLRDLEYEPEDKPKGEGSSAEDRFYGGEGNSDLVVEGARQQIAIGVEEEAYEIVDSDTLPPLPEPTDKLGGGKSFLKPDDKDSPAPRKRSGFSVFGKGSRTWSTRSTKGDFGESVQVEFVDRPSEDYQCPICFSVVRDPYLTNCCGARFCKRCIVEWKNREGQCPMCREDFVCMPDKRLDREIRQMKVHCVHSSKGCQWIGTYNELRRHRKSKCEHEIVSCSRGCKATMPRKDLLKHLQDTCSLRQVVCEFCHLVEGTYVDIQEHKQSCGLVPEPCPNDCGVEPLDRQYMKQHLGFCPLQEVACDFSFVGCPARVQRKDLREHIQQALGLHVMKMAERLKELRHENTSLRMTLKAQHLEEERLTACAQTYRQTIPIVPFDFTYSQYSRKDAVGGIWMGPPFYTHYKGYKLFPKIYPHGHDHGKAHFNYLTVFFGVFRGEYDDDLHWPVRIRIAVEIYSPRYPEGEPWIPSPPEAEIKFNRIVVGHLGGQSGWKIFIKPGDARRYLREDALHFRVTRLQVIEPEA